MKNILIVTTVLILLIIAGCTEDCKNCHIVTYEDGVFVSEGSPSEYCGTQLENVEGETSTVGNMTTIMVCE